MKNNGNKTASRIVAISAGLLAMGAALLAGCSGGGNSSSTSSSATWPPATPPPTSQVNTYIGTQSPGLYTITIDHTSNAFSYQDTSAGSAAVSGTFTTAANGFLIFSNGGYALEQLSRAMLLAPPVTRTGSGITLGSAPVFAISAPSCQVIPQQTKFDYLGMASPYFNSSSGESEDGIGSGLIYASTDSTGADWAFGGELQDLLAFPGVSFSPLPDPFTATCASANSGGPSVIQTAITAPDSIPASFIIGPTGYLVEDRYSSSNNGNQSFGVSLIGAVAPPSPVSLSALNGATFLGTQATGGASGANLPSLAAPQLASLTVSPDSSGKSIELTGGVFPSNDPTQTPGADFAIDLGAQDPNNNGSFPSVTVKLNTSDGIFYSAGTYNGYALVTNVGGKYTIFVQAGPVGLGYAVGWTLFQQ